MAIPQGTLKAGWVGQHAGMVGQHGQESTVC